MVTNFQITDETPIAMLTVGQQKELIYSAIRSALGGVKTPEPSKESEKRYVYGIAGIASLFNCSYVTACKLKEGILKPAILQQGRKILCDADKAIELFSKSSGQ